MTDDQKDPRQQAIDAYMALGFSESEAKKALDHPESAWEIGARVRKRTTGRPRLKRRGCLIGLAIVFLAWALLTGIVGGVVYVVDKLIHVF